MSHKPRIIGLAGPDATKLSDSIEAFNKMKQEQRMFNLIDEVSAAKRRQEINEEVKELELEIIKNEGELCRLENEIRELRVQRLECIAKMNDRKDRLYDLTQELYDS